MLFKFHIHISMIIGRLTGTSPQAAMGKGVDSQLNFGLWWGGGPPLEIMFHIHRFYKGGEGEMVIMLDNEFTCNEQVIILCISLKWCPTLQFVMVYLNGSTIRGNGSSKWGMVHLNGEWFT